MQPMLQWKSNEYYTICVYICSVRYPACHEHAPYCHLWPAPLYNIFPHYLIKCKIFDKEKVIEHKMCVSRFSATFGLNNFHSKKNTARYYHKCTAGIEMINPLNPELNPICYLLALLGAHHFLHVSRIRVKSLTFRRLMSYIYGAPILDVSRSHTTTQHSR